jgi:hypothetical protein
MIQNLIRKREKFQFKVECIPSNPNPDNLQKDLVYVVGEKKYKKWAYLKCPCGCEDIIMLSLNKKEFPSWSVKKDKIGRASISPSIHKLDGCKSHFLIKKGKLIWVQSF